MFNAKISIGSLIAAIVSFIFVAVGHTAQLEEVAASRWQWTGVAVTDDHQIFINFPRWSERMEYSVARLNEKGRPLPFPDASWNDWQPGQQVKADKFVAVQSVIRDAANSIWVLDTGSPYFKGVIEGAPRLFNFNASDGRLLKTYKFASLVVKKHSYLNDVRIDLEHNTAYITDSGAGGLVVLDLDTGKARRVLDGHPATLSEDTDIIFEGKRWLMGGAPPRIHSDGIAYDAIQDVLYFQALTGRTLYQISAGMLRNDSLDESFLAENVIKAATTFPVDGLIMDGKSRLYLSNLEEGAIDRLAFEGGERVLTRLVQSPLIEWPDSFSLTADGWLYLATSQIHKGDNPSEPYRLLRFNLSNSGK